MSQNSITLEHIIVEASVIQSMLTNTFRSGREKLANLAAMRLAEAAILKITSGAECGKRATEIDWQTILLDFPIIFRRRAVVAVHDELIRKGYMVLADSQKGYPWKPRPNHYPNKMMIIVPGQVGPELVEGEDTPEFTSIQIDVNG